MNGRRPRRQKGKADRRQLFCFRRDSFSFTARQSSIFGEVVCQSRDTKADGGKTCLFDTAHPFFGEALPSIACEIWTSHKGGLG